MKSKFPIVISLLIPGLLFSVIMPIVFGKQRSDTPVRLMIGIGIVLVIAALVVGVRHTKRNKDI